MQTITFPRARNTHTINPPPLREADREIGYYADKEDAYYMKKELQAHAPQRTRRTRQADPLPQPLQYTFEDL